MTTHPLDILDTPSGLGGSIWKSFWMHTAVVALLAGWAYWKGTQPVMGDPDALGGAVGIGVVNSIPLPQSSGVRTPIADDTEAETPREKEKQVKEEKEKEALEKLLERDLKPTAKKPRSTAKETKEVAENQVRSPESRVSSPIFTGSVGSGGIGARSSTFGNQFGAYMQAVQQRISSKWRPTELDARLKNGPTCVVAFNIMRDGKVDGLRVVQGSGNQELDLSAQRAVTEASPFEPLPQGYPGSVAKMEVGFKLQR
ncbi:MAG TPA: energy transducer TonB [Bryobacteraceae bacterium]|jgi:protein TonB